MYSTTHLWWWWGGGVEILYVFVVKVNAALSAIPCVAINIIAFFRFKLNIFRPFMSILILDPGT